MGRCDRTVGFNLQPKRGYGANINVWMGALCIAMQHNMSLVSHYSWGRGSLFPWNGPRKLCSSTEFAAPLACHFGAATNPCHKSLRRAGASDTDHKLLLSEQRGWKENSTLTPANGFSYMMLGQAQLPVWPGCPEWALRTGKGGRTQNFLVAAAEFLFAHLPADLERRAAAAATELFGASGAPSSLISVHIRWGDKGKEIDLLHIQQYTAAVEKIAAKYGLVGADVHVFLMTEDQSALDSFNEEAQRRGWRVYCYKQAIIQQSRPSVGHASAGAKSKGSFINHSVVTREEGRIARAPYLFAGHNEMGMHSLISLMLGMEAVHYVLTISSSWSRLINALRLALFPGDRGQAELLFSKEFGHKRKSDPMRLLGHVKEDSSLDASAFNSIEVMADYAAIWRRY